MGAQLNIKSEDAYQLASELAGLTGESLTTAVTRAISERLERERRAQDRDERLRKANEILADIRSRLGYPLPSSNHDWLFDDDGLPR